MTSKRCFKCGEVKDLTAFYAHKEMADGHLNKCKECTKRDVKVHYADTRPERAAYERERCQRPERKAKALAYQKTRRAAHPEKNAARQIVNNAIRDRKLSRRPCEVCGSTTRVEAHHSDYSLPLDVRWLCFFHQREAHGQRPLQTG